jgi:hypothetical protein
MERQKLLIDYRTYKEESNGSFRTKKYSDKLKHIG